MAHSKTEFELKLIGPASDIARIPYLHWADEFAAGPGEWTRLVSTYFDSADGRLRAARLSLRIREEAGARTLTAKLARGGGAVLRLEAERALEEEEPVWATGVAEIDRIIGVKPGDLAPVARTVTDRWSRLIAIDRALIELSAETGRAERLGENPGAAAVAEVEIELLKGDPAGLFTASRRIIAAFEGRLRLSSRSKLERALGAGAPPRLAKQKRIEIGEDGTAADILLAALQPIALRICEAASLIIDFHDSDAARQLRVALRRLRAAARTFKIAHGGDCLGSLAEQAKTIARKIGEARDLDVFFQESLSLAQAPPAALASIAAPLEARRAALWNEAALLLSGREFSEFTLDLYAAAFLAPWRVAAGQRLAMPARLYADELLDGRWARLLRTGAAADFANPPTLHPLRLELKNFRYAAQFVRDLYPAESRTEFFASMAALQGAMGAVNDAVVAERIASEAGEGRGPEAARAAGFIAGYRGAEAAAAAAQVGERWLEFSGSAPFWRIAESIVAP